MEHACPAAAVARFCFVCAVAAMLIYGSAETVWMLYPPMALLGLSLGGFATISSLASQVSPRPSPTLTPPTPDASHP